MENGKKTTDVLFENLARLFEERADNTEKMLYEISELSYLIARKDVSENELFSDDENAEDGIRKNLSERILSRRPCLPEYERWLAEDGERTVLMHKAAFALFLSERTEGQTNALPWEKDRFCVAHVPSPLAKEAFERLSALYKEATVLYVGSAEEALSAVASGDAELALLPLVHLDGERIATMERLSERYDMYLNACVSINGEDGDAVFGAFSRQNLPLRNDRELYLEFRFTTWSYASAAKIISLLPCFGYETVRFSCLFAEDARVSARIVLRGEGDEAALWTFLSLTANGYQILGRYPLL